MNIKVPVPGDWLVEQHDDIIVRPPKGSSLTRRTMPEVDIEEKDDYLLFYFLFDNETAALHFKLKYL